MALFLPRGHQRPNAILGRIDGHPQARSLVHWLPILGSDPFTVGQIFVGLYSGLADVTSPQGVNVKEGPHTTKTTLVDWPGSVARNNDTASAPSSGLVFIPHVNAFTGAAIGGQGATLSVWIKLAVHLPTAMNYTGFAVCAKPGVPTASHYVWTDGTAYLTSLRHDRISFTPRTDVRRDEWHLLTITHTGYVWKCYQNAMLAYTDTTGDGNVYVGGGANYICLGGDYNDGAYVIAGHTCDWRLYNRALSEGEIQTLYHPSTRWSLYYGV